MPVQRTGATGLQHGEHVPPLHKIAHNSATDSENKIHDDAAAQKLGLRGGLVPGVTLYAYLSELMLPLLGPDWLRRGTCTVRFVRPVYENEEVECTASLSSKSGDLDKGAVTFDIAVLGPDGTVRVAGSAGLDLTSSPSPARTLPARTQAAASTLNGSRQELTIDSAPIGVHLIPHTLLVDAEAVHAYADEVTDPTPWYRSASPFGLPLVPPGLLAGQPARLLRQNYTYGPSVHTASEIQHLDLPLAGGMYQIDARLLETFTRRGNDYLVADVEVADHRRLPVMRIRHTSIFRFAPRGQG